jgi:predicted RNase H-like HicB family nuclease
MAVRYYRVLAAQEPRGWSAVFPELAGCATCGDTLNDALRMAIEAAAGWIEATAAHGNPIPDPLPLDAPLPAWMDQDTEVDWRSHERVLVPVDTGETAQSRHARDRPSLAS